MVNKNRSIELKGKMDRNSKFNRVLVASNYDSVSFNYRNIGRFQVVHKDGENQTTIELWLNGEPLNVLATVKRGGKTTLKDVKYHCDIIIDNTRELMKRASK